LDALVGSATKFINKTVFFLSIMLVASGSLSYGKRNGKPYLMRYKRAF